MSTRKAYEEKLQTQLDSYSAEIEELKARADKSEADKKPWHRQQVEALQEKHRQARERLAEFKKAGDDAWDDLKTGIGSAWDSLGDAMNSARKQFNKLSD